MLCWQAAVCALREVLQWHNFAGLYEGCQLRSAEGELVHVKARLRAQEAFEKLGNWGQVRWAPTGPHAPLLASQMSPTAVRLRNGSMARRPSYNHLCQQQRAALWAGGASCAGQT